MGYALRSARIASSRSMSGVTWPSALPVTANDPACGVSSGAIPTVCHEPSRPHHRPHPVTCASRSHHAARGLQALLSEGHSTPVAEARPRSRRRCGHPGHVGQPRMILGDSDKPHIYDQITGYAGLAACSGIAPPPYRAAAALCQVARQLRPRSGAQPSSLELRRPISSSRSRSRCTQSLAGRRLAEIKRADGILQLGGQRAVDVIVLQSLLHR